MSSGLIQLIKRVAMDAVDNHQMCDLRYGKVVSVSPLKVKITNQLTIPSSVLVVPEHLTDRDVSVTIDGEVKTIMVHNTLNIGDNVALLRKQGGQSYFILDRI